MKIPIDLQSPTTNLLLISFYQKFHRQSNTNEFFKKLTKYLVDGFLFSGNENSDNLIFYHGNR
jgi:hypothetical protein